MSDSDTLIQVYVNNGEAFVWNAEDWHKLRSIHRICGALTGSIPSHPRQNDFLGLPLSLMPEEAALLVAKGICELRELPKLAQKPTEKDKSEFKEAEQIIHEEQSKTLQKRKLDQLMEKIDMIVAGKKQKLLNQGLTENFDKEAFIQEKIDQLPGLSPAHALVHMPTEDFLNTECRKISINDLEPNLESGQAALKYTIFTDLWERGYHITNGSKFGCDYLVYPGDPVKFHATYMVRCMNNEKRLNPTAIVAFGRLAVAVNKLAVFAILNKQNKVEYQTLQWHDSIN